jgi:hypothetical protein
MKTRYAMVRIWCKKYSWMQRRDAYLIHIDNVKLRQRDRAIEEMDIRHSDAGRFVLETGLKSLVKTREKLNHPSSEPLEVQDALRAVHTGAELEREARIPGGSNSQRNVDVKIAQQLAVNLTLDRETGLRMAEIFLARHKEQIPPEGENGTNGAA